MEQKEIWKDIPGYEGLYQASDLGRIKSFKQKNIIKDGKKTIHYSELILKSLKNNSGYDYVHLFKDRKPKSFSIHCLVAMSFLGHIPRGRRIVIDHINNNKNDNRAKNLQIISQRINSCKDKNQKSGNYCIYRNCEKWLVRLRVNGTKISIGTFEDIEDALKKACKGISEKQANLLFNRPIRKIIKQKTYVIYDSLSDIYKIGRSENPKKRLSTLQISNKNISIVLICDDDVESLLHDRFSEKSVYGEWFNLDANDLLELIEIFNFKKYNFNL